MRATHALNISSGKKNSYLQTFVRMAVCQEVVFISSAEDPSVEGRGEAINHGHIRDLCGGEKHCIDITKCLFRGYFRFRSFQEAVACEVNPQPLDSRNNM